MKAKKKALSMMMRGKCKLSKAGKEEKPAGEGKADLGRVSEAEGTASQQGATCEDKSMKRALGFLL